MIRNYFKTAFRNILKHRVLSFVNVLGLTIGLTCTILIAIFVRHELSYDKFHKNSDRIYRVERIGELDGTEFHSPHTNHLFVPKLAEEYPEIKEYTRIWHISALLRDYKENFHEEELYCADPGFFEIFSFSLLKGNRGQALKNPNSIVITPKVARKYFGTTDVLGETIEFQKWGQNVAVEVTGIMEEFPQNTHFQTDMIMSYKTIEPMANPQILNSWIAGYLFSYVMLDESANVENLKANFPGFVDNHLGVYKQAIDIGDKKLSDFFRIYLQPLEDIYLFADVPYAIGPEGDINKLYTAGAIALLILIIACINYINLSTAKSLTRSKEVVLRKVFGADRKRIVTQFLTESILLAFIALVISMVVLEAIMPAFNSYLNKDLTIGYFQNPLIVVILVAFSLFIGLLAGIYPSLQISSYLPTSVLKHKGKSGKGTGSAIVRKGLVILQFAISVGLIISVFTMNQQLQFMVDKDPGFHKENVLIIPISEQKLQQQMGSVKEELRKIPAVQEIGRADKYFGDNSYSDYDFRRKGVPPRDGNNVKIIHVDPDFIPSMDIKMVAGRNYSRSFQTDRQQAYVLNEKAIRELGFASPEDAIGKEVIMTFVDGQHPGKVIGVMKDFHYKSMESKINPMAFLYQPNQTDKLFVRLAGGIQMDESLKKIRRVFETYSTHFTFDYKFLDQEFDANYQNEIKMRKLFTIFTLLAIFIACMGLFGLASFLTEQKTKEIGIRKAIGASSSRIVFMLSSDFLKWVLVSNLIAWPLIYVLLNKWLQNFAYHVQINIIYFVLASLITLVIAQATVFYKAFTAARTNPTDSLRYE